MLDFSVDLKQIAAGLDRHQLLQIIGAWYLENDYGYDDNDSDLENVDQFIGCTGDLLESIGEVISNIDRQENGDDWEDDCYDDDYDEDYDDDYEYDDDEDDYTDDETQRLIEANRKKNNEFLGL